MSSKLGIDYQADNRVIFTVNHDGKLWEIDVRVHPDEDGGIVAHVHRDDIFVTRVKFGWHDKHENEPKD